MPRPTFESATLIVKIQFSSLKSIAHILSSSYHIRHLSDKISTFLFACIIAFCFTHYRTETCNHIDTIPYT